MASIVFMGSTGKANYYPLGRRTTVIGRAESVPVQILDEQVSRRHLQIHYESADEKYYALDMKSKHGTYINGRRLSGETVLADGDEIQVGRTKLLFTTKDFPDRESALLHYKKAGERGRSTLPER